MALYINLPGRPQIFPLLSFLSCPKTMENSNVRGDMPSRSAQEEERDRDRSSLSSPVKKSIVTRSLSRSALFDQIVTPEKSIDPPRFPRGRGVVYSLNEIKKAASARRQIVLKEKESAGDGEVMAAEKKKKKIGEGFEFGCGDLPPKPSSKGIVAAVKIPEKYENLAQFFKCMETSIRLLKLKGQMTTLSNISPKIEYLTDRRFLYRHLAQLKYILPEAILTKKVLLHDEVTCCMKPDLQINLTVDAFEGTAIKKKQESGYSFLAKLFRARLEEFCKEHSMGDDVPEAELPEPFNYKKPKIAAKKTEDLSPAVSPSLASSDLVNAIPDMPFAIPSHMSGSFKRRFSQKTLPSVKTKLLSIKELSDTKPTGPKSSALSTTTSQPPVQGPEVSVKEEGNLIADCDSHPVKGVSAIFDGTPTKALSTPSKSKLALTPNLQTPNSKDDISTSGRKSSVRRPLTLSPVKFNETDVDDSGDAALNFLPKSLLQSIRKKERKALEDQQEGVAESKRRQKMIASLPKLFDIIHLIFQSANRSILTKQELISKIITSQFDMVDKCEVEEQLDLFEELAPEWIHGKTSLSGDLILCINKIPSLESIRQKLANAN